MADKTPTSKTPVGRSTSQDVQAFLKKAAGIPMRAPDGKSGRLVFAMDATASRGPTWMQAMNIQTEMFQEAASVGGLDVQLVYYRGMMDFGASPWMGNAERMVALMRSVDVIGGATQIERVLNHANAESKRGKVNAVVFIGDAVEEPADSIAAAAGQLALRGVPVFVFHEGGGEPAATVFKQIAQITRGAYCSFDAGSAQQLRDLLKAVAIFAAGGRKALENFSKSTGGLVLKLTHQVSGK
jgi:hypothetical protein